MPETDAPAGEKEKSYVVIFGHQSSRTGTCERSKSCKHIKLNSRKLKSVCRTPRKIASNECSKCASHTRSDGTCMANICNILSALRWSSTGLPHASCRSSCDITTLVSVGRITAVDWQELGECGLSANGVCQCCLSSSIVSDASVTGASGTLNAGHSVTRGGQNCPDCELVRDTTDSRNDLILPHFDKTSRNGQKNRRT